MKLFSKITVICNISFLIFIILGYIEFNQKQQKVDDNIIPLPFVTGTLVVLGQLAVFINLIFCLLVLYKKFAKKIIPVPAWIVLLNMIFFLLQVFYFFIY